MSIKSLKDCSPTGSAEDRHGQAPTGLHLLVTNHCHSVSGTEITCGRGEEEETEGSISKLPFPRRTMGTRIQQGADEFCSRQGCLHLPGIPLPQAEEEEEDGSGIRVTAWVRLPAGSCGISWAAQQV